MLLSCMMHRLPILTLPAKESSFERGCTTLSELIVMVFAPVSRAESAMVMEDENWTGGFGPAWEMGGRIECRLLDEEEDMAGKTTGK